MNMIYELGPGWRAGGVRVAEGDVRTWTESGFLSIKIILSFVFTLFDV